jgi:hypothetical protein
MEALHLPVCLWPIGLRGQMAHLSCEEELAQGAVVGVAPSVVAHQSLRRDAVPFKPRERSADELGDSLGALVAVQLDIGQAGVVIDDRVREVIAHPRAVSHPAAAAPRAISGGTMTGSLKARVARGIHVQQITRARPLVATRSISRLTRASRETVAVKHLPDGRVRMTRLSRDQPRSPAGASPRFADPLLSHMVKQLRRAKRTTAPIGRPRQ